MKTTILTAVLVILSLGLFAQVSINTDGADPDGSAMLDVKSTDKGMLVPRMTTDQRTTISSPATGLLVFDETTGGFWFYNGSVWTDLSAPDSDWTISGNNMYSGVSGNVGIGTSAPSALLDVNGNIQLSDSTIYFRNGTDENHGLGWYGSSKEFAGQNIDGPVLFGYNGGALGSDQSGTQNVAVHWKSDGKVGIGTTSPDLSAKLEINSTTKGFLPPRLSKIEMLNIASPAEGLVVYNTTSKTLNVFDGTH